MGQLLRLCYLRASDGGCNRKDKKLRWLRMIVFNGKHVETNQVGSFAVQFDSTGDIKKQLHTGNFGIEGNAGILYRLKSVSYFVEAGGNYGFVNLQKNTRNGINYTGALIFRIGISYGLDSERK